MPRIPQNELKLLKAEIAAMDDNFNNWRPHFNEVAELVLPRRYDWLSAQSPLAHAHNPNANQVKDRDRRNKTILDPTATKAVRILAAGLLNGIASPARPWFDLSVEGFEDGRNPYVPVVVARWAEQVRRVLFRIMAESNFYNAMALTFLDLASFGTNATLIYEDYDEVIRCYSSVMGEYRLGTNEKGIVDKYSRILVMTVESLVNKFGIENVSDDVRRNYEAGGSQLYRPISIQHILRPNLNKPWMGKKSIIEVYFETKTKDGRLLAFNAYTEKPGYFPRWEIIGQEVYGTSPIMDALPDVRQLQVEIKQKGTAIDYMNRPPIVADQSMRNTTGSLLPGSRTYVSSHSSVGAKPIWLVNPPLQEMQNDIQRLQNSIYEFCHNDLFRMISQLDTVRSATEIDARREEKLVQLGAVLERFENEALNPAIYRIYKIAERKGLLPEPPEELQNASFSVKYTSILSEAQKAAGTASMERFLQVLGQSIPVWPELAAIPDVNELIRDYADRLSLPPGSIKPRDQVAAEQQARAEQEAAQQQALLGETLTNAGKNLSETDVGGGQSAMASLLSS